MKYAAEKFVDFYPDAEKLFKLHHEEIDLFGQELDVDIPRYQACCHANSLRVYTLREEGELVGYCAFFLFRHTHHKTSIHARQDVLYIKKSRRGHGLTFLKFCEDQLKAAGVQVVHQCVPAINDWSPILERKGYRKLETIYCKEL